MNNKILTFFEDAIKRVTIQKPRKEAINEKSNEQHKGIQKKKVVTTRLRKNQMNKQEIPTETYEK